MPSRQASAAEPVAPAAAGLSAVLIFVEHPDGRLQLGLPPGWELPEAPPSPRGVVLGTNELESFELHERIFFGLLVAELALEAAFSVVLLCCARHSVTEVGLAFRTLPTSLLWCIFWCIFGSALVYLKVYYCLGFTAVCKNRPRIYTWFTSVALAGIVGQVLFAYMNRMNLLAFSLRLILYMYAKFMRNRLQRWSLLPVTHV